MSVNCYYLSAVQGSVISYTSELLLLLSNYLLTIIRDYLGWSLTGNRKLKNMPNFWTKKWLWSLKKFEWWSLTRELLKQYLTENQNGYLRSGRFREVVAYDKWSLNERVDCSITSPSNHKTFI